MAITVAGIGVTFNGSGERNRHGAGVAFAAVGVVGDGDQGLRRIDDGVGNADVRAVVLAGAEVGVEANGGADVVDDGGGIGIDRRRGNIFVPEIVGGEWKEAVETGTLSDGHLTATGSLRRAIHLEI